MQSLKNEEDLQKLAKDIFTYVDILDKQAGIILGIIKYLLEKMPNENFRRYALAYISDFRNLKDDGSDNLWWQKEIIQ